MSSFLSLLLEYHKMRTNSPLKYAIHLGVQLVGHSLGYRSVCKIMPRAVHHNTFLCLLGKSGKAMKSTAQEDIQLPLIPSEFRGPKNFSPEGLLREMETNYSILCPMGEFSTVLRGIKMGGHMANFKEISNDLFNCPVDYRKRLAGKHSYYITYPYLSISTTCTEEEFFPNLNPEMVHGGFLPRWLLAHCKTPKRKKREDLPDNIDQVELFLKKVVKSMYKAFEKRPLTFKLDDGAKEKYEEICELLEEDEKYKDIQHFIKRIENYIIAYADIICVSDIVGKLLEKKYNINKLNELNVINKINKLNEINNDSKDILSMLFSPFISLISVKSSHIERAWKVLEPIVEYSRQTIRYVDENYYIGKVKSQLDKLDKDEQINWTKLLQKSGLLASMFFSVIHTLASREEIELIKVTTGEGRSKATSQWIKKLY